MFKIITDNAKSMIKAYKFGLFGDDEADIFDDQIGMIPDMNKPLIEDDGECYYIFKIWFAEVEPTVKKLIQAALWCLTVFILRDSL